MGLGLFMVADLTLRLVDPQFSISERRVIKICLPTGFIGGIMQGVVSASDPLAFLFLSSQNLARPMFIGPISAFFLTNSRIQAPALWWEGLLTPRWIGISALALIPVWLCLPLCNKAEQRFAAEAFNRWVMALLAILAVVVPLSNTFAGYS